MGFGIGLGSSVSSTGADVVSRFFSSGCFCSAGAGGGGGACCSNVAEGAEGKLFASCAGEEMTKIAAKGAVHNKREIRMER
jgi:hypothetical protein